MLLINNKQYRIIKKEIKLVESKSNQIDGYSLLVNINFDELDKENYIPGYIHFYLDFTKINNISYFENKKYKVNPFGLDKRIDMIEIYDINNFIDYIDSNIILEFENIINNQINMKLSINDESIKIDFNDSMDII